MLGFSDKMAYAMVTIYLGRILSLDYLNQPVFFVHYQVIQAVTKLDPRSLEVTNIPKKGHVNSASLKELSGLWNT